MPLLSMMNFKPFHCRGLCDEVIITPLPYFRDSLKTTGVGAIPKLYTSSPLSIKEAMATSLKILLEGLVSRATTHFFDFTNKEKFWQNFIMSLCFMLRKNYRSKDLLKNF